MKIAFGNDHAGFDEPEPYYKPELVKYLEDLGHEVIDCGSFEPGAVDYPDHGRAVAKKILGGEAELGVLLCGTGIGISIAANRYAGIRASVCTSEDMARLAREHNDANVLCIGRRVLTLAQCKAAIDAFLEGTASEVERHQRRVSKLGEHGEQA